MKSLLTFIFLSVVLFVEAQTNIFPSTGAAGIGTTAPDASSLLEVKSTTKGVLITRMTKAQRDAIPTPAVGLLIYQTNNTPGFYYYSGTAWTPISTKGANTNLSNLKSPTAINADLLPDSNNTRRMGSAALQWKEINGITVGLGGGNIIYNTALGAAALANNSAGSGNTATGDHALFMNTTGIDNVGYGSSSLYHNTSGGGNSAYGFLSLANNTSGYANTAGGYQALGGNTTGINNSAIGAYALQSNTTGHDNVASGYSALYSNTLGSNNIAIGTSALFKNQTISNLVAVGDSALFNNGTGAVFPLGNYNVAVGSKALFSNTSGMDNSALGFWSLYSNAGGSSNTGVGSFSLYANTTGYRNTAAGVSALYSNLNGIDNTATGTDALRNNTDGTLNTAVGSEALKANIHGYGNTAVGFEALDSNTVGTFNTSIGSQSLWRNQTGSNNVAIGQRALWSSVNNSGNIAIGDSALSAYNDGSYTDLLVAIGQYSAAKNTIGYDNTALGGYSLFLNTTGIGNTAIGTNALYNCSTGSQNTVLGSEANISTGSLNNCTALGYGAIADASNKVRVGNTSVTSIGGQVSWTTFSDGRYKKNVKENIPGLEFIKALRPISYTVDVNGLDEYFVKNQKHADDRRNAENETTSKDAASRIIQNGFIAQEVEAAAQKLNYNFSGVDRPQTKDGLYGLRYSDFVVPLVKAVQELSKMNDSKDEEISAQNKKIDALQTQLNEMRSIILQIQQCTPCTSAQTSKAATIADNASLQQNVPNPFNHTTTINYTLPQTYSSAQLVVVDKSGKILKQINVSGSGQGSLQLDASVLSSGAYNYSLYINGKLIDSKQMILTR